MEVGKLNKIILAIRSGGIIIASDLEGLSKSDLAYVLSAIISELQDMKRQQKK